MRKKGFVILLVVLLFGVILGIGFVPYFKNTIKNHYAWHYRNDNPGMDNIDRYDNLCLDENAWYSKYHVIAHSGGGIENHTYTDSLDAWELSYANGTRVFDADLCFTSDTHIVLRHEWSDDLGQDNISETEIPTYEKFICTKIFEKYTPMDVIMMFEFMAKYDDTYVAIDFKDGTEIISSLVENALINGYQDLLNRIIISFYTFDDYYEVATIYDFKNYAIRQYDNCNNNYYEMAEFCLRENIPVVMVYTSRLDDDDHLEILTQKGIQVWGAVINDQSKYARWNLNGIVSDWISEDDYKSRL